MESVGSQAALLYGNVYLFNRKTGKLECWRNIFGGLLNAVREVRRVLWREMSLAGHSPQAREKEGNDVAGCVAESHDVLRMS